MYSTHSFSPYIEQKYIELSTLILQLSSVFNRSMRDKRGYYTINVSDHPFRDKRNRVYEHRVILEKYLSEKYNMTMDELL